MKVDKIDISNIKHIKKYYSGKERVVATLEFLREKVSEAQREAISQVQDVRLGDLWNLIETSLEELEALK